MSRLGHDASRLRFCESYILLHAWVNGLANESGRNLMMCGSSNPDRAMFLRGEDPLQEQPERQRFKRRAHTSRRGYDRGGDKVWAENIVGMSRGTGFCMTRRMGNDAVLSMQATASGWRPN